MKIKFPDFKVRIVRKVSIMVSETRQKRKKLMNNEQRRYGKNDTISVLQKKL